MHILGFILIVSGLLIVTYSPGPKSSSENAEPPPQGQVAALPINSPNPNNKEDTVTIRNKKTGEVKQVPKSEVTNYVPTPQPQPKATKASDKALKLAIYILTFSSEKQKTEFVNKFSDGKNDLALAVNNLALFLDSKPEALALAEKTVAQDLANRKSQEELEYHEKEYQRLKELNNSLNTSSNSYSYIGGTQNTNRGNQIPWSGLSEQKSQQPLIPTQNTYKGPVRYDVIGDSVYGSDGSRYDRIGDSIYKNDGTRYDIIGDSIYGNDGSRYDQIGDSIYKNDGTRYDAIGDTVYGSDGSRYYNIGDTIYAQPGF